MRGVKGSAESFPARVAGGAALAVLLVAGMAAAQFLPPMTPPSVSMAPAPATSIPRGKPGQVALQFRISRGFHINSNTPRSELLIPTTLKLDPPTDIVVSGVSYPRGKDESFPFDPEEKLNVYSGDFILRVEVRPLKSVLPGKYVVRGKLKYQACNDRACFPPKQLPVSFEVKVYQPSGSVVRPNRQSPHVHR